MYDYHAGADTLLAKHFPAAKRGVSSTGASGTAGSADSSEGGYANPFNVGGEARPYSAGKGAKTQQQLLPEVTLWNYVIQLSSIIRTIHSMNLACRFTLLSLLPNQRFALKSVLSNECNPARFEGLTPRS